MVYEGPDTFDVNAMTKDFLDQLPVALTVFDADDRIVYYNAYAGELLNRKPEYIGRDVRLCHTTPDSKARLAEILDDIKSGRSKQIRYEANPYGTPLIVTVAPLTIDGRFAGYVQAVVKKP
jgi:DUF438 domain-containing protein